MNYQFDYLIVGAGLFGSVFAHQMAKRGFRCLVIEKRNHIGGNCWSEKIESINCHKYGPHTFHTDKREIWDFINSVVEFYPFMLRTKIRIEDKIYSFPINLMTMHQIYGITTPEEFRVKLQEIQEKGKGISNVESWTKSQVGPLLYDLFFKEYTEKQWGRSSKDIPSFVARRIPIRYSFDDNYFSCKYQGLPVGGYQGLFNNLLKDIYVRCDTDFFGDREYWKKVARKIIFTGKIDEFYDYKFGGLEYRGLMFDVKTFPFPDFQGCPIINYPSLKIPYTRTVEYKHMEWGCETEHTVVVYETPFEAGREDVPYYPINDAKNHQRYYKYTEISRKDEHVIFCGRIGSYTYNDMDKTIENALYLVKEELERIL